MQPSPSVSATRLPRSATHFSDCTALVYGWRRTPGPQQAASAPLKTRNQLHTRSTVLKHLPLGDGPAHRYAIPHHKKQLENLRRNARRITPLYGPLIGLPMNNSASNFAGAAHIVPRWSSRAFDGLNRGDRPDQWPWAVPRCRRDWERARRSSSAMASRAVMP